MKLVCEFSGWFEIDPSQVRLSDMDGKFQYMTKTAAEWIALKGNIDGLVLENFSKSHAESQGNDFTELNLRLDQ